MAQFDVYRNLNADSHKAIPYLLDVQMDLLDTLNTRVVVPLLRPAQMPKPARILNPGFAVGGETVIMSTPELASVPVGVLGDKIGSLREYRHAIMAAMDFLLTGI